MPVITGVGAAFVQSVLPVLLIGGLGYLVGRARSLAPITGLTVLVLVPAIVFDSFARAALPRDLLSRLVLHVALQLAAVWLLTVVVARLVGWRGPAQGAFLLATLFANAGNVGLPLALFAFGPDGLAVAGGWFAVMSIGPARSARTWRRGRASASAGPLPGWDGSRSSMQWSRG